MKDDRRSAEPRLERLVNEGIGLGGLLRHMTPASSEIGRLAQLLKAAGMTASTVVAPPSSPAPGSDAAIAEELDGGS